MKKMFVFAAVMMFMLSAITLIGCSKKEELSPSEVPSTEAETTVEETTELPTTEPETTEYYEETTFQLETAAHRSWGVEYDENGMPILVPMD